MTDLDREKILSELLLAHATRKDGLSVMDLWWVMRNPGPPTTLRSRVDRLVAEGYLHKRRVGYKTVIALDRRGLEELGVSPDSAVWSISGARERGAK